MPTVLEFLQKFKATAEKGEQGKYLLAFPDSNTTRHWINGACDLMPEAEFRRAAIILILNGSMLFFRTIGRTDDARRYTDGIEFKDAYVDPRIDKTCKQIIAARVR